MNVFINLCYSCYFVYVCVHASVCAHAQTSIIVLQYLISLVAQMFHVYIFCFICILIFDNSRVWICNKVAKSFALRAAKTYASAFALRQRMLNCVQNLEYYMMVEVIEPNWVTFFASINKVSHNDIECSFVGKEYV